MVLVVVCVVDEEGGEAQEPERLLWVSDETACALCWYFA